jgi:putative DNA primase/helicase
MKDSAAHHKLRNIPPELRDRPQWAWSDGKPGAGDKEGKRPRNAKTGAFASSTDPATWSTFDEAVAAVTRNGGGHVGYMLSADDPFAIVDLDDKAAKPATDAERIHFAQIVKELDSYSERSSSGRGIHIIVEAELAKGIHRGNVEIYDRDRYMICTGDVMQKRPIAKRPSEVAALVARIAPAPVATLASATVAAVVELPDAEVLARIVDSCAAAAELARCEDWASLGYDSHSTADLALMNHVALFAANDEQAIRIFRACPLGQRDKAMRDDYMRATLAKARDAQRFGSDGPASLFSDTANAARIVHHMGSFLLCVPGLGWHVWDGARWRLDALEARRHVGKLGRLIMGEAAAIAEKAAKIADRDRAERERELAEKVLKFAGQAENVAKIDAAMKAAEPLLRADADKLDADPWLLGCANGVIDLQTGTLRAPDPQNLITKSTGVAYDAAAIAPTWSAFLARIFRSHPELPGFLQRLAGLWLTGITDPPFLAVLYGVGANGKSTLVNAISQAMGDYASAAPPGLLMAKYGQTHPTELAFLQGQRFVVAAESREGGKLDEERIKALTGSDAIAARRMHQDFYTFLPTHKLALMTNHKPVVRGMDEGIWRRLLLIPFDEVIPEAERDPTLTGRLRAEAPGILRWMVDGARMLHENNGRLDLPEAVKVATRDYRTESDVLGEFISETCDVVPSGEVASATLYAMYVAWCEDNGERALTKTSFGLRLKDRGFVGDKDKRGNRVWTGLRHRVPGAKFQ